MACFCAEPPKVLHYGLLYDIKGTSYSFDKHWHYGERRVSAPPLGQRERTRGKRGRNQCSAQQLGRMGGMV